MKAEIAICQEFSNKIYYKESENSILVSVDKTYFEDLKNQLNKLDYKVISETTEKDFITVEFAKIHKVY